MPPAALDYAALGFKAGLEIHQQLDTRKLFCRCPGALDETTSASFLRTLRPTASELGEVDRAAVEEARKELVFHYRASRDTSCLVELDEEPPHAMTPETVDVALTISLLLGMRPVDEVHVMRKIVIDGSNTSGFQRTSLFALDGRLDSSLGPVGVATLCLEEDSARKVERVGNVVSYRLDRLGIPLVEIATTPDIRSPDHAREVAEALGWALRATGRVKRGIGTIRQDLNVSIRDGARIEIKGVQELRLIPLAVEYEVRRQVKLVELRETLRARGVASSRVAEAPLVDVSSLFTGTEAKTLKAALDKKGVVLALALPGFGGLIGRRTDAPPGAVPEPRFGRELADYAKVKAGVKGIFHSDELPAYGVVDAEVRAIRDRLVLAEADAFALVAAPRAQAERALEGVRERALLAFERVPEETRDVLDDGSSQYLRPLPGGARMYPETDVPPFLVTAEALARTRATLPELLPAKLARWASEYPDLSEEQRRVLAKSAEAPLFERLARESGLVKEAARVLLNTLPELERDGVPVEKLGEDALLDAFRALGGGAFAKEALPQVLKHLATHGGLATGAARSLGLGAVDRDAVVREIDLVIAERDAFVKERGLAAVGPLMGPLMGKFRGKLSGEELASLLKERIEARLRG